ncbi:MAG: hypothetical protein SFW08_08765 [Gemmatimonadaceae bacterium]|nr:hypothetical protein [Gemmatimonadaceae bacterium]
MSPRLRLLTVLLLASAGLGCDPTKPLRVIDDPRPIRRVVVRPDTIVAAVGDTVQYDAAALAAGDREASEFTATWTVGNPGAARAVGAGRVVATGVGTSEIFATIRGLRGRAVLVVR